MKTVNAAVSTAIRSAHEVKALPSLQAEWNLNRYVPITSVTNTPDELDEGYDIEVFPIESIVEPIRPTKGFLKGIIGQGVVSDAYHAPTQARSHIASVDDKYKYWVSPTLSDASGNITNVAPQVLYTSTVTTNKISITVENTWATPTVFSIQTTVNGGGVWTTITTPTVQNNGKMELWWNGSTWVTTRPADLSFTTTLNGIKLLVTKLGAGKRIDGTTTAYKTPGSSTLVNTTGANSYFSLIEISPRLVVDFTSRLIQNNDTFDAGEANHLTPVGRTTTNDASVTLWNGDNYLSTENLSSPYHGFLEPNVEFNLSYIYDIASVKYPVQQFKMYVNAWAEGDDATTTVSLSDFSKFLKEIKPRPTKYENHTVAQIVYRLCDAVGFNDYVINEAPNAADFQIPVWYTDGEQTVWEIFEELAESTQTLIYFDAFGRLQVKSREDAYPTNTSPVWNLRAVKAGTDLPDIVRLEQTDTYEANVVKVIYNTTHWADEVANGFPEFTTVWSPESTTVLRSSPLTKQLDPGDEYIHLSGSEAKIWPYSGLVQIEGETIRYEGKMFKYFVGGTGTTVQVNNNDEYKKYNAKSSSGSRWTNHFDGRLKIVEREVWNTEAVTHRVDAGGYTGKRFGPSTFSNGLAGFHHNKQRSTVTLRSGGRLDDPSRFMVVTRGNEADTAWRHLGTRIKFNSNNNVDQRAGLVFNVSGNRGGYYVELTPTSHLSNKERSSRKELTFYTYTGTTPNARIPLHGVGATILEDRWHNVDIYHTWDSHRVAIWIDGKKYLDINVPSGAQRITPNGKFGMFIRGRTEAEFEYLYAIARADEPVPEEDFSSLWAIDGWHTGLELKKEWRFKERRRKRRIKKKSNKWKKNFQYMDEFGPYVHEIREFDVKFDPAPVQYSKIFSTNTWAGMLVDYRADAFGARFTIANSERYHAVIHGEDSKTFPGVDGKVINQQLLVFGRALVTGEDEEVTVRNEAQVRARGEIVTEVSSPWIQTKDAATALGDWITGHWGVAADQLQVEVFGNPLFEVGDLVGIDYPSKSMTTTTHQYFVTSIQTAFDTGITTSLTLQRKN